ncbi:MAG: M15 family metallopeptidase [Erysipelotrichaceae bacterium]|nr:M15 family metallopeptidase [Erysipelotrichaceae bacterium]
MARRLSKRGWIVILSGLLVILMGSICAHLIFDRPEITFKEPLEYEYRQKLTVSDLVSEVKKGELINGEEEIDAAVLGAQQVTVKTKNHYGRKYSCDVSITVKDIQAPVITAPDRITLVRGQQVDLLAYASVTDDAGEATLELIEGYDPQKVGMQMIEYRAVDTSGNVSGCRTSVVVKENEDDQRDYFLTYSGHSGYRENGRTFIEGIPIINKTYGLPSGYGARGLTKDTSAAWQKMKEAAAADGITLKVLSAYRNYGHQEEVFNKKVAEEGEQQALLTSEKAGHSEHQAGIALDVNSFKESFAQTREYEWLNKNCYKYGFIIRYPQGKTDYTGYVFEPWHITYVGEQWAKVFYNDGNWICIEEYFMITSEYGD